MAAGTTSAAGPRASSRATRHALGTPRTGYGARLRHCSPSSAEGKASPAGSPGTGKTLLRATGIPVPDQRNPSIPSGTSGRVGAGSGNRPIAAAARNGAEDTGGVRRVRQATPSGVVRGRPVDRGTRRRHDPRKRGCASGPGRGEVEGQGAATAVGHQKNPGGQFPSGTSENTTDRLTAGPRWVGPSGVLVGAVGGGVHRDGPAGVALGVGLGAPGARPAREWRDLVRAWCGASRAGASSRAPVPCRPARRRLPPLSPSRSARP